MVPIGVDRVFVFVVEVLPHARESLLEMFIKFTIVHSLYNILSFYNFKSICITMWFLNYCAPFYFRDDQSINAYRFILYSEVFALFFVYLLFIVLYKVSGKERLQRETFRKQPKETLRQMIALKFAPEDYWISQKNFKEWYLNYFTLHSVSAGISLMYAPYLPQVIFVCLHFVTFMIAVILLHCRKKGAIKIIYNVCMVISCLMNICLLFSGSMGVGASGYDENEKICLLQSETST